MLTPTDYSAKCFDDALQYIDGVLSGEIVVGELVRLAVERHVRDLQNQRKGGIYFDPEGADRVFRFFSFLRHSLAEWAGQQFVLSPWQSFIVLVLFGWKRANGFRRFVIAYLQVARKNGKTTFLAGIGLYLAFADGEPGAEVYVAATKRDQAKKTHDEAVRMRAQSPELAKRIKSYRDNLHIDATAQKFVPIGSDADTTDGLNSHANLIDELHAHKTRRLWDVLVSGTGARRQALTCAITTAGFDLQSICWEQRDYAEKILRQIIDDDSYFAFVAEPDKGDDWRDESTWIKGNPNLGVSVYLEKLREEFRRADVSPAGQNSFRRLKLDEWTEQENRWIDVNAWNALPAVERAVEGARCYAGLDLSSTTDLTAFVLAFPPDEHPEWTILPYFWMPEDGLRERSRNDKVEYEAWVRDGWIKATPGDMVDYDFVREDIVNAAALYRIEEVAYDRWNSSQIVTQLTGDGLTMIPMGQGYASMSAPSKEFMRLILAKQINHQDNPVLRWMASNVMALQDPAGNIKPDKAKSRHRIDGIVAMIMAIDRAMRHGGKPESVYKKRGIRTL